MEGSPISTGSEIGRRFITSRNSTSQFSTSAGSNKADIDDKQISTRKHQLALGINDSTYLGWTNLLLKRPDIEVAWC